MMAILLKDPMWVQSCRRMAIDMYSMTNEVEGTYIAHLYKKIAGGVFAFLDGSAL